MLNFKFGGMSTRIQVPLPAEPADAIKARGLAGNVCRSCAVVAADADRLALALRHLLARALEFTVYAPLAMIGIGGRDTASGRLP